MKQKFYEFLKPSPYNLVLTFVIFYFFVPFLIIPVLLIGCIGTGCPQSQSGWLTLFDCQSDSRLNCLELLRTGTASINYFMLSVGLVFSYLVSCILAKGTALLLAKILKQ